MIQYLFSLTMQRPSRARGKRLPGSTLHIEFLEARYVFAGAPPVILENWQSAIFDEEVSGTLPFSFSRGVDTVDLEGDLVPSEEPRYGDEQLLAESGTWTNVLEGFGANTQVFASGWDHDGQSPLAVFWSITTRKLTFVSGDDFTMIRELQLPGNSDLFGGQVSGYRYTPQAGIVHEGLVVLMLERDRREGATWVTEGISFAYTQDQGQSFQRVEQVGGGYDVPAIPGGATDGMGRGRSWSFANAFPEKSTDDVLGAWFPWADYIQKEGGPKGGQIGLFRARRSAVGEPWVVEANRTVYETWREDDSGGFHAHSAGMLVDGMASFWGDVSYRNRMARHVAEDLENYTTTTWTHEEDFHGAWSPSNAPVHTLGNQATSAAPGPVFGEVLVAGDEQVELVMKIQRPENLGEKAIITNLHGSFPGVYAGLGFVGRISLSLIHQRGVGYVATEMSTHVPGSNGLFFSPDGENWAELLNYGGNKYLYGDRIIAVSGSGLYSLDVPQNVSAASPLLLNPGGQNLATSDPLQFSGPSAGNTARRVLYVDGAYVYQDTLEPLDVQPSGPPPVMDGMPLWEFTATGANPSMGAWELGNILSESNKLHWLSAWHYSLDGNGISPSFRVGDQVNTERESVWVANSHWVPSQNFGMPNGLSPTDEQKIRMINGSDPAPRRWLTAIEGYNQGAAPTYPLSPGSTGGNELASVQLVNTTTSWSTALTFGLSELSSFSTHFDPVGTGTVHTLASIYKSNTDHIDVTFTKTATAQGVIAIDVYSSNVLLDRLSFKNIYFDRQDQIRMVLSNSPDEFGVTLLVTRNGYGMDSKSIVSSGTSIVPTQIRLSNATRTVVEPMEWYAIQFSPTQALTTAERETMVCLSYMFERLDAPPVIGPPGFDDDDDIDGRDFLIWQRGFGITEWAMREDGDANLDGRVDGLDLTAWQAGYGIGGPVDPLGADFNLDNVVDGADLAAWQEGYGTTGTAGARGQGDADNDGDVDGRDFLFWQRQFNGTPAETPPEETAGESASVQGSDSEGIAPLDSIVASSRELEAAAEISDYAEPEPDTVAVDATDSDVIVENFWLPLRPQLGIAIKRESIDELLLQELVLLKKYPFGIDVVHTNHGTNDVKWPPGDDQPTELDPYSLSDWDLSADLAIEEWQAF
jgi:hypothetical protein